MTIKLHKECANIYVGELGHERADKVTYVQNGDYFRMVFDGQKVISRKYDVYLDYQNNTFADATALKTYLDDLLTITPQEQVKVSYYDKQVDGIDFYNDYRADIAYKYITEVYTQQEAIDVEIYLQDVGDALSKGNWITAKDLLEAKAAPEGVFDQTMKDEILLGINTYITNNY